MRHTEGKYVRRMGFSVEFGEGVFGHICYSSEVPELIEWLRENFADEVNAYEEIKRDL